MVTLLLVVLSVCVSVMFLQFRLDFGWLIDWLLVFNATFSNISAISWIRFWNCSDSVVFKKTLILLIRAVVVVIIWIYNYLCNQCLSPRKMWVRSSLMARCTTWCDEVCQWLAAGRWFSPGNQVSTYKTARHDIIEILLKVALNTTTLTPFY